MDYKRQPVIGRQVKTSIAESSVDFVKRTGGGAEIEDDFVKSCERHQKMLHLRKAIPDWAQNGRLWGACLSITAVAVAVFALYPSQQPHGATALQTKTSVMAADLVPLVVGSIGEADHSQQLRRLLEEQYTFPTTEDIIVQPFGETGLYSVMIGKMRFVIDASGAYIVPIKGMVTMEKGLAMLGVKRSVQDISPSSSAAQAPATQKAELRGIERPAAQIDTSLLPPELQETPIAKEPIVPKEADQVGSVPAVVDTLVASQAVSSQPSEGEGTTQEQIETVKTVVEVLTPYTVHYPAKGNANGQLLVLFDAKCKYCKKFYEQVSGLQAQGIDIKLANYPIYPGANDIFQRSFCSSDPATALRSEIGGFAERFDWKEKAGCVATEPFSQIVAKYVKVPGTPFFFIPEVGMGDMSLARAYLAGLGVTLK
ncbi:hypothetical protein D3C80_121290 [compost metagenome]